MKLSLALSAALLVVPTMALPDGFVQQCCYYVDPDTVDPDSVPGDDFITADGISGYGHPFCDEDYDLPDDVVCISWEELCTVTVVSDVPEFEQFGDSTNYVCDKPEDDGSGANPDGVQCCLDPAKGLFNVADQPWTCALVIGSRFGGTASTTKTDLGYMCGKTFGCKDNVGPGCEPIDPPCVVACGDPHFQKWDGEWFDFHGECDLVYIEEPNFMGGLGLTIHIRTKARSDYSYIESAVVRIGDDVLQVDSYGEYFFNGVEGADMENAAFFEQIPIKYENPEPNKSIFIIDLGRGEDIKIQTFKDLVAVRLENAGQFDFQKSYGIMGSYPHGTMLARDGKTIMLDPIEFGMEWQVRGEEDMLFQYARAPQHANGEKCIMPTQIAGAERRRLGEMVSKGAAEAACKNVDHVHHDSCVYDVMATGDLEIAKAGVF